MQMKWTNGQTTQPVRITNLPQLSSKLFESVAVALYPALKIRRLKPVEALNYI